MYRFPGIVVSMPFFGSMRLRALAVAATLLCKAVVLYSQVTLATVPPVHSTEKVEQLRENIKKLEITLRLDRTEYFPSEDAELTKTRN